MNRETTVLTGSLLLLMAMAAQAGAATPLLYNVQSVEASGPPYPSTSLVRLGVFAEEDLLPAVQKTQIAAGIQELLVDGVARAGSLFGSHNGGDLPLGTGGGLELLIGWDIDLAASGRLHLQSLTPDGKDPVAMELHNFSWTETSFEVSFGELLGDGSVHNQRLNGQITRAQDFHFKSFSATAGSVMLDFELERIGPDSGGTGPLVTMALTGERVPEPASALLLACGAAVLHRRKRA